jgi:hypothetical protein
MKRKNDFGRRLDLQAWMADPYLSLGVSVHNSLTSTPAKKIKSKNKKSKKLKINIEDISDGNL